VGRLGRNGPDVAVVFVAVFALIISFRI